MFILFSIILNLFAITLVCKSKLTYGINKLLMAIIILIIWLMLSFFMNINNDSALFFKLYYYKSALNILFIPFISMYLIEFSTYKKLPLLTSLIICIIPIITIFIYLIPQLFTSYQIAKLISVYHRNFWHDMDIYYSYILTTLCLLKFFLVYIKNDERIKNKQCILIISSALILLYNLLSVTTLGTQKFDIFLVLISLTILPFFLTLEYVSQHDLDENILR